MCPIMTAIAENYSVVIVDIKFENDAWKASYNRLFEMVSH